ncbi:PDDEXK-like family protein [Sphingobacterium sp. MYb382]|uniref:PDDEXK-like family protein n=1 Tax=Sphingobacterium sp. MYb382 TaxID=2745278 RepID=UPI0030B139C2
MINKTTESFFREVRHKEELQHKLNEVYRKALTLDFNPLDFVRWNENKVSEIIAFFLDPHGSHGQGDLYLKTFIEYFELAFYYSDINKVKVTVEAGTDENRRIDILISYDNFKRVIGIENKIYLWTKDQELQVSDYMQYLKKFCRTEDYHLIYLAPQGKILNEYSAGEHQQELILDGKLKVISYEEHMINLIHRFVIQTDNNRVRAFIKDFELKLKEKFIGNRMTEENDIVKYIKNSEENIKVAFSIAENLTTVKNLLKEEFTVQMEEVAFELNIYFDVKHNHFVLSNFRKLHAKFNFESGGLIYGLVKTPEFYYSNSERIYLNEIAEILKIRFSNSPWWPLWTFLYEDISIDYSLWNDIQNGKVKAFVKEFLQELINLPLDLTKDL